MTGWLLRLAGVVLMLGALSLPLLRTPDRPVETLVARWAPPPSRFVEIDGQLLHYRDEGPRDDPSPVVLLHGFSDSLHGWEGWARGLRAKRRVVSLDLPGFGLTGPWTGRYAGRAYSADADAGFVIDLLDRLALPHAVFVGHSHGGEVAWRIAVRAPRRVDRLVLVAATGYPLDGAAQPLAWRIARLPLLGRLSEELMARPLVVQGLAAAVGDPSRVTDAMVDRHVELTLRAGNRHAFVERLRQAGDDAGVEHVGGIAVPTLILWGGRDRLLPPALARRFAADIPGSRLQLFNDLGHLPHEEDAQRTVAALKAFLGTAD